MNSNWFKLVMKMTKVEYGKNLLLEGVPIIFNKSGAKLKIGENVTIKSSFLSNLVGLYSRTIIVTRAPGAKIEIGNNVGISGATIYARKKITIGENTCIGGNCKIRTMTFILSKQKRETSFCEMKTVVTVIKCRAEKLRLVRTVSSGVTASY